MLPFSGLLNNTLKKLPLNTSAPQPRLGVVMGATNLQTLVMASYTSTELRQFQESQPPAAYTALLKAATPAW